MQKVKLDLKVQLNHGETTDQAMARTTDLNLNSYLCDRAQQDSYLASAIIATETETETEIIAKTIPHA